MEKHVFEVFSIVLGLKFDKKCRRNDKPQIEFSTIRLNQSRLMASTLSVCNNSDGSVRACPLLSPLQAHIHSHPSPN